MKGDNSAADSDQETLTPNSEVDSSAASDKDIHAGARTPSSVSDFECLECLECLECDAESTTSGSGRSTAPEEMLACKPVVEVKLFDFVRNAAPVQSAAPAARTKLRAAARPFASARAPPAGIQRVIASARDVLECDPGVVRVDIVEGAMGGTFSMVAHTRGPFRNLRSLLAMVKSALVTSTEHSQGTYILGYDVKPFTKIDKCSFSTTLATIPDEQQRTACWDSYKHGFCPRRISCRWTHPSETQVMRLIVRVQHEPSESQEVQHESPEVCEAQKEA